MDYVETLLLLLSTKTQVKNQKFIQVWNGIR